ncbi:uncharacterized protein CLUP02_00206 [Colletotrichum lupini]|uniref:Uncharacterized protein n=1 Tax=Colletotrichum lupini TaxID=145971 RepID=A0A9Q8S9G0_9PEZI|nr:uncharacterized protein CLUP02_00206 [Colletotrichum lupini]UQC73561.1 hypothetical protein CLUP02_00206 [Colletotrichum lupini]
MRGQTNHLPLLLFVKSDAAAFDAANSQVFHPKATAHTAVLVRWYLRQLTKRYLITSRQSCWKANLEERSLFNYRQQDVWLRHCIWENFSLIGLRKGMITLSQFRDWLGKKSALGNHTPGHSWRCHFPSPRSSTASDDATRLSRLPPNPRVLEPHSAAGSVHTLASSPLRFGLRLGDTRNRIFAFETKRDQGSSLIVPVEPQSRESSGIPDELQPGEECNRDGRHPTSNSWLMLSSVVGNHPEGTSTRIERHLSIRDPTNTRLPTQLGNLDRSNACKMPEDTTHPTLALQTFRHDPDPLCARGTTGITFFALAIVSRRTPVSRPIPSARSIKGHSKIWPGLAAGKFPEYGDWGMNSTGKKVRDLDARCLAEHRLRRRPCQPAFNSFRAATDMDAKGQIQSTSSHQPAERTSALGASDSLNLVVPRRMTRERNHNHISMPMFEACHPKAHVRIRWRPGDSEQRFSSKEKARFRCWWPACHTTKVYATSKAWAKHATNYRKPVAAIAVIAGPNANLSIGFRSDSSPWLPHTRPSAIALGAHAVRHRWSSTSGTWPEAAMPSIRDSDPNQPESLRFWYEPRRTTAARILCLYNILHLVKRAGTPLASVDVGALRSTNRGHGPDLLAAVVGPSAIFLGARTVHSALPKLKDSSLLSLPHQAHHLRKQADAEDIKETQTLNFAGGRSRSKPTPLSTLLLPITVFHASTRDQSCNINDRSARWWTTVSPTSPYRSATNFAQSVLCTEHRTVLSISWLDDLTSFHNDLSQAIILIIPDRLPCQHIQTYA